MKTIISDDCLKLAQNMVDSYPDGTVVALAFNEDTMKLNLSGKIVYQLCDAGNLIADRFKFDKLIGDYNEEPIELCILGLGYKGQIGFNEVATPFDSITHDQKLTSTTREEYSFLGDVPDYGRTMGIKSICSSKEIMVVATSEKRSNALFGMLYGRDDSTIPAAFLQIPVNVTVFADSEAASKL